MVNKGMLVFIEVVRGWLCRFDHVTVVSVTQPGRSSTFNVRVVLAVSHIVHYLIFYLLIKLALFVCIYVRCGSRNVVMYCTDTGSCHIVC